MDSVILKDSRARGVLAAGALLLAAACGGDDEQAATTAAKDSAAAPAVAAAPEALPSFRQPGAPPAQPGGSVLDSAMSPAEAAEAARAAPAAQGPVNVQALNEYRLTMEKMSQLAQVGRNLSALQARRPDLRDSMRVQAMDPNMVFERISAVPEVREAVTRAGMSPREYATAMAALIQASMVYTMRRAGQTPQGQFNETNVKFVEENWSEIEQMMRAVPPPPQTQKN